MVFQVNTQDMAKRCKEEKGNKDGELIANAKVLFARARAALQGVVAPILTAEIWV